MPSLVNGIKGIIAAEESARLEVQMVVESTLSADDKLRDKFLDDPESEIAGAENDPKIQKLIDSLPEYDGSDSAMENNITAALESIQ